METESPGGLNLHPAKQPRTTLFDWLPAGLPSVPTWTNLHESLRVSLSFSLFLLLSSPLSSIPSFASYFSFFLLLPSRFLSLSLLSFCFVGTTLFSSPLPPRPLVVLLLPPISSTALRYWISVGTVHGDSRVETHFVPRSV